MQRSSRGQGRRKEERRKEAREREDARSAVGRFPPLPRERQALLQADTTTGQPNGPSRTNGYTRGYTGRRITNREQPTRQRRTGTKIRARPRHSVAGEKREKNRLPSLCPLHKGKASQKEVLAGLKILDFPRSKGV